MFYILYKFIIIHNIIQKKSQNNSIVLDRI